MSLAQLCMNDKKGEKASFWMSRTREKESRNLYDDSVSQHLWRAMGDVESVSHTTRMTEFPHTSPAVDTQHPHISQWSPFERDSGRI
ncbi:r3h domain [Moniliophthora roreri]|nr:r3h domain [Moniliophthora roreri]